MIIAILKYYINLCISHFLILMYVREREIEEKDKVKTDIL